MAPEWLVLMKEVIRAIQVTTALVGAIVVVLEKVFFMTCEGEEDFDREKERGRVGG